MQAVNTNLFRADCVLAKTFTNTSVSGSFVVIWTNQPCRKTICIESK